MKILDGQVGKRCDETEYATYTHKRCPVCDQVKAVGLFYRKTTKTARGWAWDSHCIECRREACREYGASNKGLRNQRLRRWRQDNPVAAASLDKRRTQSSASRGTSTTILADLSINRAMQTSYSNSQTRDTFRVPPTRKARKVNKRRKIAEEFRQAYAEGRQRRGVVAARQAAPDVVWWHGVRSARGVVAQG